MGIFGSPELKKTKNIVDSMGIGGIGGGTVESTPKPMDAAGLASGGAMGSLSDQAQGKRADMENNTGLPSSPQEFFKKKKKGHKDGFPHAKGGFEQPEEE
jgi:hypothetical protein